MREVSFVASVKYGIRLVNIAGVDGRCLSIESFPSI